MTRLGTRQLELLRAAGTTSALVGAAALADTRTRVQRLCGLGLMREVRGGLYCVTADGLRALADGVDAGRVSLFELKKDDKP